MPLPSELLEQLPEDLRTDETLSRFNSVEDLAKSYREIRSLQGSSIRIPNEDAGSDARNEFINKLINNAPELMFKPDFTNPEQSDEFFKTLGVPDDFAAYKNPEGVSLEPDTEAELRQVLHKARLTPDQYSRVIDQLSAMHKETLTTMTSKRDQDMKSLQGRWGNAMEDRVEAAKKTNAEFYTVNGVVRPFENLNSAEIEALYQIHTSVTGTSLQTAQQPNTQTMRMTPHEALEASNEIIRNKALYDPSVPASEKKRLMDRVIELRKEAGMTEELPRAGY